MALKPITVWGHWGAPNPFKVCLILEALEVPYKVNSLEFSEVKNESYTKLNPNGRLPTIEDPNSGVVLWESGAIIQYLIDQYDQDAKISYKTLPEKYQTLQWLAFQISGQGPYFGQATWFARFHKEKLPSATERYVDEMYRVYGVIETQLERNGDWLVGSKCTYADLSFVTWALVGEGLVKELGKTLDFPRYAAWMSRLQAMPSVQTIQKLMAKGRAEHGLK